MLMAARTERHGSERYARVLVALLGAAVLYALLPFLSGFVGAAVLAIAVNPAYERLSRHTSKRTAAVIATTSTVLLVLVPGAALVMSLVAQAPGVARAVTGSPLLQRLGTLQIAGIEIGAYADSAVTALVAWFSRQALALVGGLTLATLNALVSILGLYYLLMANGSAWRAIRGLLPFSSATLDVLATRFRTTTESMILGILLTAVAQGAVVGGAFALVGLSNAPFWGFVTGCASVLPIVGSAFVWVPGTLVLVADHRYGAAVTLGLIGLIVASQIDNVIRPIVYRRVSQIHPLVTLVGAFAGMRVFGFAGLLLGPLGISYLIELLKAYRVEYGDGAEADIAAD